MAEQLDKGLYPPYMTAESPVIARLMLAGTMHHYGLSRERAEFVCKQLCRTFNICTNTNVQRCKSLIITHFVPVKAARTALFKYLEYLAKQFKPYKKGWHWNVPGEKAPPHMLKLDEFQGLINSNGEMMEPPQSSYRRLHIVYVVFDVMSTLCSWKISGSAPEAFRGVDLDAAMGDFKQHMTRLLELAACSGYMDVDFDDDASEDLVNLVDKLKKLDVFTYEELDTLREKAKTSHTRVHTEVVRKLEYDNDEKNGELRELARIATEADRKHVRLPLRHGVKGSPDAPWHQLPATNGLYMRCTRGYPLKAAAFPVGGYNLERGGDLISAELKKDVEWLKKEMRHCFDDFTVPEDIQDIDPMGNKVWKDPDRPTRNYWGFTSEGVEKAKENKKRFRESATGYTDVAPLRGSEYADDPVARARELAASRGSFGGRGRGGRGRGEWGGGRGGGNGGAGGWRGGRGGGGGPPRGGFY